MLNGTGVGNIVVIAGGGGGAGSGASAGAGGVGGGDGNDDTPDSAGGGGGGSSVVQSPAVEVEVVPGMLRASSRAGNGVLSITFTVGAVTAVVGTSALTG